LENNSFAIGERNIGCSNHGCLLLSGSIEIAMGKCGVRSKKKAPQKCGAFFIS
jgi:hypothetical protein